MSKRILLTGGTGMVGSAFNHINTEHEIITIGSADFNFKDYQDTKYAIIKHTPDAIIHLAAKVGGVKGNTDYMADFYTDNIIINTNILRAAHLLEIKKVVSLLSTCVYPEQATYPLTEDQIHNGPPHKSNYGYAYAKRMIDIQSQAYRQQFNDNFVTAIPNNIYGENDNFNLEIGHVIPAIIRKIWEAKKFGTEVVLWGDGTPLREFTYSRDIARALLFVLDNYNEPTPVNIGTTAEEYSIKQIAEMIADNLSYKGEIVWDSTKPAGQFRKPSSNKRFIDAGWPPEKYTTLSTGLSITCKWFTENYPLIRL